jgi:peptide/nickel transport system substrate-binding protein
MIAQNGASTGISRRSVLRSGAAIGMAFGVPAVRGIGRASAADFSTLKVIPEVDLKILDPVWTTATVTSTHALLVYDTLFGIDRKQQIHPQMVEKFGRDEDGLTWHFELRDGLGWQDGTPVTAKDCVA